MHLLKRIKLSCLLGLLALPAFADQSVFSAIAKGDTAKLQRWLTAQPSQVNLADNAGNTLLLQAAQQQQFAAVKLLVKAGANVNALNHKQRDILNAAVTNSDSALVKFALANGADPQLVTSIYQGSALIYATHQGQVEIVEQLIDAGAPLNRVNNLGWTALLEATILGDGSLVYQRIVSMLLAAGADPNIADNSGKTPFDHARDKGHQTLTNLLHNEQ
jgi:ankyrin repeat protein